MKKLLAIIVGCILCMCLLSGCGLGSLFGGGSNSGENGDSSSKGSATITVYNDEQSAEFSVKYGAQAGVTSFTKSNYYLKGYYTEREGGQKYFGADGKSTAVWQQGNPATFYAQWEPLSQLTYTDTTKDGAYGQLMVLYAYSASTFTPEMLNGIKGNLDKELTFNLSVDARDSSNIHMSELYITNSTGSGRIKYMLDKNIDLTTDWKKLNYSKTISAREFSGGKFYVYFVTDVNTTHEHQFLRDIKISVTFA